MGWTLGGKKCLDPSEERANAEQLGYPRGPWYSRANCFVNPIGVGPARGIVLLRRAHLDELDLDAYHDLVISDGDGQQLLKGLIVTDWQVVSPGARSDPAAACAVGIADSRHLALSTAVNRAYNTPDTSGTFLAASKNASSDWTWETLAEDLWTAATFLGDWPTLPYTPDGVPEGWRFWGWSAYLALCRVLEHLSCAIAWDSGQDVYSVVRIGSGSEPSSLVVRDRRRIWDSEPDEPTLARVAGTVRVFFPKLLTTADSTGASIFYSKDVTTGAPAGSDADCIAIIHDEKAAIYSDSGSTLTNGTALDARAAELAADYFRRAQMDRLDRLYTGAPDDSGLLPGSQIFSQGHYLRGSDVDEHGSEFAGHVTGISRLRGHNPLDAGIRFGSGQTIGPAGAGIYSDTPALWRGAAVWWDNEEGRPRAMVREIDPPSGSSLDANLSNLFGGAGTGTFSITGGEGVYQDVGVSGNIPADGSYILFGQALAQIEMPGSGWGYISVRLYNTTAGAAIGGSHTMVVYSRGSAAGLVSATAPIFAFCSSSSPLAAGDNIKMQACRISQFGTYTTTNVIQIADGETKFGWLRVGS